MFQEDVMEACERIGSRAECTSSDAKSEVDSILCDISQPASGLGCSPSAPRNRSVAFHTVAFLIQSFNVAVDRVATP